MNLDLNINDEDKKLLLTCICSYKEKIEFVLKNSKFYFINDFIIDSFKEDLKNLGILQIKLFSINVSNNKTEGGGE